MPAHARHKGLKTRRDKKIMEYYTLKEIKEKTHITLRLLRGFIKTGELKASKVGRSYIVQEVDLIDFLNSKKVNKRI